MKRLIAVLSGLLVLPAFAEVAPIYYDEVVEHTDAEIVDENVAETDAAEAVKVIQPVVQPSKVNPRGAAASSRTASRVVPSANKSVNSRSVSARNTAATRNATQSRTGTVTSRASVSSRGATARVAARPSRSATTTNAGVTARRATTDTPVNTARAGALTQKDTVSTPLYTGRVSTRSYGSVQARMPSTLSLTNTSSNDDALAELTDIDELTQNTDYCKAQYTACMDNFCNVLDDNQGRCSCSKNLDNYAETEEALKKATIALEEVAQQVRYIGLTTTQIESLFAETEAEIALSDSKNNQSDIEDQLTSIKRMIVSIEPGSANTTSTGMNFDSSNGLLDFGSFTSGFNFSSLNMFGSNTKNVSISNQRGEQLYKTAVARCKTAVLNTCAAQGVDTSIITNAYDLEIDKQCIAYERSLTEANETMASTVRNAKVVLQNARLMVAQQKNAYSLRECVEQLDSCVREDFVCGDDYENCLDPTGRYIAGGKIVIGSTPGISTVMNPGDNTLYSTWNYPATDESETGDLYTWSTDGTLGEYIDSYLIEDNVKENLTQKLDFMARYLQSKIGYIDETGKAIGMCSGVLNQCQDYTYIDSGNAKDKKYNPANQVIRNYLERTLVQIKAEQDALIDTYAEDCITQDVATCLSQNDFDETHSKVALNACKQQIVTCMSVNGENFEQDKTAYTDTQIKDWALRILGEEDQIVSDFTSMSNCRDSGGTATMLTNGQVTCTCPALSENDGDRCVPVEGAEWDGSKFKCAANHEETDGKCTKIDD